MQDVVDPEAELVSARLARLFPAGDVSPSDPVGSPRAVDPSDPDGGPVAPDHAGAHSMPGELTGRHVPRPAVVPAGTARLGAGAFDRGGSGVSVAFDPGRRGVRALAVVAVVVVVGAALFAWRSRPHPQPLPAPPVVAAADSVAPSPSGAAEVVVTVAGKVRRAGLVRLPAGARVGDALAAAGGALPGIDPALLNPARKVADGELIVVGISPPPGAIPPAGPAAATPGLAGGKVNLNVATLAQLDALPGVGPVLAQRILDHRDRQGGFRSVGDLRQVDGIGQARYDQLKELVSP